MNPGPLEVEHEVQLSAVQNAFCDSDTLYRAFCGGVGSGKTWVGAFDLLTRAAQFGGTYMVGSPTGVMMTDTTFPTFKSIAEKLSLWGECKLTPYPNVTLTTGAVVRFRTAEDPERMRGPNLTGIWLDEASLMKRAAYDVSIARLREGGQLGWLSATFTPKGPSHWTHEIFATEQPDTILFRAATDVNPFLHADFQSKLQQQYGETNFARQELGGEFVQLEGAEFPAEWFAGDDLWFDAWPDRPVLKVMALDPSKGSDGKGKDYQAHVMISVTVEDGKFVLYVGIDVQREGVTQMCDRTVSLCRQFDAAGSRRVDSVVVEENATMGLFPPALEAACAKASYLMPWICRTNTDGKEFRIRYYVGPPLSRRQIRFRRTPGCRMLVGQLQSFPFDEYDDAADALSTGLRRVTEMLQGM